MYINLVLIVLSGENVSSGSQDPVMMGYSSSHFDGTKPSKPPKGAEMGSSDNTDRGDVSLIFSITITFYIILQRTRGHTDQAGDRTEIDCTRSSRVNVINFLLIVCMLVGEWNRQVSHKGGLHLDK